MSNTYKKSKPFYMVYTEGENIPAVKYPNYIDAFNEAKRLRDELRVSCCILESYQYLPVSNKGEFPIELEDLKKTYWFYAKGDAAEQWSLIDKLQKLLGVDYISEGQGFPDGTFVYGYDKDILFNADEKSEELIKQFGTELRIKEE
jgi:hypothetical protein